MSEASVPPPSFAPVGWSSMTVTELLRQLSEAAEIAFRVEPERAGLSVPGLLEGPLKELRAAIALARPALRWAAAHYDRDEGLADLASIATWDLGRLDASLASLGETDAAEWILNASCDARAQIGWSLGAVEEAVASREGRSAHLTPWLEAELARSLSLRSAYDAFRSLIRAVGDPREADLREHLDLAAGLLEALEAGEGNQSMRMAERLRVRALLDAIETWRSREPSPATTSDGLRLWKDLWAFAELLIQINDRAELRDHDLRMAEGRQQAAPLIEAPHPDDAGS